MGFLPGGPAGSGSSKLTVNVTSAFLSVGFKMMRDSWPLYDPSLPSLDHLRGTGRMGGREVSDLDGLGVA
jgi:hypothetical protein